MKNTRNAERLSELREAINAEAPVDGIHNPDVEVLYEHGGKCPRYLACTSEGSAESSYRSNPDFIATNSMRDLANLLAGQYEEGWCMNWARDLDTGKDLNVALRIKVAR